MANHRAEDVIAKVKTLVTGLTTTGSHVERGRFYPFAEDVAAGLTVRQGQFTPVGEGNVGPLSGKGDGRGAANSPAGPGDESDLVGEFHHSPLWWGDDRLVQLGKKLRLRREF